MFSKTKSYYLFFLILLLSFESNLSQAKLAFGQEIKDISMKKLNKSGVIDLKKLISDDTFYLRIDNHRDDIFYLKKGRDNKPFILNINTLDIEGVSEKEWLRCQDELVGPYFDPGGYVNRDGILREIHTGKIIKPSGKHVLKHTVSPSGTKMFIYSFSGNYRKKTGLGFFPSPCKKRGRNYFEIWDVEKEEKIFSKDKFSFSCRYNPYLLFWLEEQKVIMFSNRYKNSLMLIKY